MIKNSVLCLSLVFIFGLQSATADAAIQSSSIRPVMKSLGEVLADLFPVMMSDASEPLPAETLQQVMQLKVLFAQVKPHFEKKSLTYKVSYSTMEKNLSSIEQLVRDGVSSRVKQRLRGVAATCASCHQHSQKKRQLLFTKKPTLSSPMAMAEFHFITRDYAVAKAQYEALVKSSSVSNAVVQQSLSRLLMIYAHYDISPKAAIQFLQGLLVYPHLNNMTKQKINLWVSSFERWEKTTLDSASIEQLEKVVTALFGENNASIGAFFTDESKRVEVLQLRNRLEAILNENAHVDAIPKIILWLSYCERALDEEGQSYMADLYLKECMTRFSGTDWAVQCFREFRSSIKFGYTGSGGTHIPEAVQDELEYFQGQAFQLKSSR
ncbi:MAG: hypothetical protein HOM11_06075 [Methylococcales bacterium]|nr:hypothetical protein [Methylococcales bacterium]MBT7445233.1 hypothetical protein [Methylococcales bacterium]